MFPLAPGIAAGISLGISDVLAKIIFAAGTDVLTMLSFRSVVGLAFVASWLHFGPKASADARVRSVSLVIGVLFTGLIFWLFKAIEAIDVPTAVLSYFTYPLLTGLAASLAGIEPLRWKGVLCALAAFFGLAVMIGAHPAGLAFAGVGYALGAACCRTGVLLVTRAYLVGADARMTTWYSMISSTAIFVAVSLATQTWHPPQTDLCVGYALAAACCRTGVLLVTRAYLVGADARMTTWYSMISSTAIFVAVSLATRTWHPPQTGLGWTCLVAVSLATTAAILFIFVSTVRIGPFRTALIMHLEPLTAMIVSALVLGEVITPIQGLGSAIMLAALVAFQLWR